MNLARPNRATPVLGFVGPMLGTLPATPPNQAEVLAHLLGRDGYEIRLTSPIRNRLLRLGDAVRSMLSWSKEVDMVIVTVFSGRAFVFADITSSVAKSLGKPLVFTLYGGGLPHFARRYPTWVRRVLRRADLLVAPSDFLTPILEGWGLDVEIIPNILDLPDYPYHERARARPNLLWMRSFHRVYRPEMPIQAFRRVRQSHPDAHLTMAGADKGLLAPTMRLAQQLGVAEGVSFPGYLDMSQKRELFKTHDIFLNTTRVDSMPVSLLEAAAFGLPIITTNVGGIPLVFKDREAAILVADGDSEAMAEAVEEIIVQPELGRKLSRNGRDVAEHCSWQKVKRVWERLFDQLLANA